MIIAVFCGFILSFIGCLFIDKWFYGNWVLAAYNYFHQNLVEGKASGFGTDPWYQYAKKLLWGQLLLLGPASLLGYLLFIIRYPKHPLVWVSFPFLLVHSLVAHKEFRFLLPLIFIMPICVYSSMDFLSESKTLIKIGKVLKVPLLILNFLLMQIAIFLPPSDNFWFLKNLYEMDFKRGQLIVYDQEINLPSPYHDGQLRFSFLRNPEHQIQFESFEIWKKKMDAGILEKEDCPIFITKLRREESLLQYVQKKCGQLEIIYENLYAPLLRKIQEKGFKLPEDVKAYIILRPIQDLRTSVQKYYELHQTS